MNKLLQSIKAAEKEFDKKFPCKEADCDNLGTIAVRIGEDEWEPQQCQYCYEEREPIKSFIRSNTIKLLEEQIEGLGGRRIKIPTVFTTQAFTSPTCKGCGNTFSWHNGVPPILCDSCAKEIRDIQTNKVLDETISMLRETIKGLRE